jgi:P27 family predicted phage terminase small subunit
MRGRKPEGSQPTTKADAPAAPTWLSDEARAEWDRLLELIATGGAIAQPDADVLAMFVSTLVTYRKAVGEIQTNGITFRTSKGIKRNPAVAVASDARKDLLRLASELGLTPISRQRLRIEGGGPDEFQLFLMR